MRSLESAPSISLLLAVAIIAATCGFITAVVARRNKRRARGFFLPGLLLRSHVRHGPAPAAARPLRARSARAARRRPCAPQLVQRRPHTRAPPTGVRVLPAPVTERRQPLDWAAFG